MQGGEAAVTSRTLRLAPGSQDFCRTSSSGSVLCAAGSDPGFSKLDTKMDSNLLQEGFYNLEFFNPPPISCPLVRPSSTCLSPVPRPPHASPLQLVSGQGVCSLGSRSSAPVCPETRSRSLRVSAKALLWDSQQGGKRVTPRLYLLTQLSPQKQVPRESGL